MAVVRGGCGQTAQIACQLQHVEFIDIGDSESSVRRCPGVRAADAIAAADCLRQAMAMPEAGRRAR